MTNLHLLYPEIALSLMALGLLVADLFVAREHRKALYQLALVGSLLALFWTGGSMSAGGQAAGLGAWKMWAVDPLSQFFKILILMTTVLALVIGHEYEGLPENQAGTFSCLLLLASAGMMFLVSSVDLLMVFISLELISISSFILSGFERFNPKSNRGRQIFVFGISLVYGATGDTSLTVAASAGNPVYLLGMLFVLLGFGFKASMAPMHFWVPDAYEGAPTPVTAYLSVAPKIAAMAAILRIFTVLVPSASLDLTALLTLLAILTMTVGNFTALFQDNAKRLLAYSSIAQAGYIMIGIVAGGERGLQGVLLYSAVYVAMNIGAFAVVIAVAQGRAGKGGDAYSLSGFNGLSARNFGLSMAMVFFLLSLAGIPPLAGFIGKFYIFLAAMEAKHYALAVAGVLNSVVSVFLHEDRLPHVPEERGTEEPVRMNPYLAGGLIARPRPCSRWNFPRTADLQRPAFGENPSLARPRCAIITA